MYLLAPSGQKQNCMHFAKQHCVDEYGSSLLIKHSTLLNFKLHSGHMT